MKKRLFILCLSFCLLFCLVGCKNTSIGSHQSDDEKTPTCSHQYDDGKTTIEPAYGKEGEVLYTCSKCNKTKKEIIPPIEEEAIITVTNKTKIPEDIHNGRYSDRVEFSFSIENLTSKDIKGIEGILTINDLFDKKILSINCDFTGNIIPALGTITVSDLGIDINQFMDNHIKLYSIDYDDLKFEYAITKVVYAQDTPQTNVYSDDSLNLSKVTVRVLEKNNLPENWNAGRYSERVEFKFGISNNVEKDIKGVEGVLCIKDMFGDEIIQINCDFTGKTIPAKGYSEFSGLGIDINQFMDNHTKLYNEKFEDLIFEYKPQKIVYTDGSNETLN